MRMCLPHNMRPRRSTFAACLLHDETQLLDGVQFRALLIKNALAGGVSAGRTHSSNQERSEAAQTGMRLFVQVTNLPRATFVLPKDVQLTDDAISAARRVGSEV